MTDHLAEARRLADVVDEWAVEGSPESQIAQAIVHLADAIEELRPTINSELTVQPETVPILLPQHRDRVWRDIFGWLVQTDRKGGWITRSKNGAGSDRWRDLEDIERRGPFTAVGAL